MCAIHHSSNIVVNHLRTMWHVICAAIVLVLIAISADAATLTPF